MGSDPARHDEAQTRTQSDLRGDVHVVRDHGQIRAVNQQPGDLTGRGATSQAHRERTLRNPAHSGHRNTSLLLSVMGIAISNR